MAACQHNTDSCFLPNFPDATAVVGLIKGGEDVEYRGEIKDFLDWNAIISILPLQKPSWVVEFKRGRRKIQQTPINHLVH